MGSTIIRSGETEAKIFLPRHQIEDEAYEQVKNLTKHEAFDGEIRLMPDMHWGSGATIGFTMPLSGAVCPNTIGVDIGCGMTAFRLEDVDVAEWRDEVFAKDVDNEIRRTIPMGFEKFDDADYHMHYDFPWHECSKKAAKFEQTTDIDIYDIESFEGYGPAYFDDLVGRVGYDPEKVINSMGTLGGGNHFIEIAESEKTGDVFVIVHSGSRGIGLHIAQYWQEQAHQATYNRNAYVEIPAKDIKYFDYGPDYTLVKDGDKHTYKVKASELELIPENIREDYEGESIEGKFGQLQSYINAGKYDKDDLDYLSGSEALGYYRDMIFAQTYAHHSRLEMAQAVADVLGAEVTEKIDSPHNFISFEDGVIRKGSTPAHEGQDVLIPINMKEGTLLCVGKGNDEWNNSAPHGAGRAMSRTEAERRFSRDSVAETMEGTYTTNIPLDEAPAAYKSISLIEENISDTVAVVDRLIPIHNIKA